MLNFVSNFVFRFDDRNRQEPKATPSKEVTSTTVNHRPPISGQFLMAHLHVRFLGTISHLASAFYVKILFFKLQTRCEIRLMCK
jgi:hypothetical protein